MATDLSIDAKLNALACVARALNAQGIAWSVGASLMLYLRGLTNQFHDIDLMVYEKDSEKAARVLDAIACRNPAAESSADSPYRSRLFIEYTLNGVEIDLIAGFTIVSNGEAHTLGDVPADGAVPVCGETIPLQPLSAWRQYYAWMGRGDRVF